MNYKIVFSFSPCGDNFLASSLLTFITNLLRARPRTKLGREVF